MKIAFIGQDIPMLLPTLLTDLLFAGKERDAEIVLEEKNPAMAEVLAGIRRSRLPEGGPGRKPPGVAPTGRRPCGGRTA